MAETQEESSWTLYIQGFICDNEKDSLSSEHESPSLVSDAASSAVKKLASNRNWKDDVDGLTLRYSDPAKTNSNMSKQNSFKKQKTFKIMSTIIDCDLEDTASSPVNSPKVSYMNQFMSLKEKAKMDVSEVKRNSLSRGGVFGIERDCNSTELKKKNTCG